ncbi:MAG TPA: HupE/UreJ family protein, partial [Longimicrobiales bacterium]|nr:HupE/UreJ family protein [Longimicrobiales bacterium]
MGSAFAVYLELGFHHIADLAGYDHILFVVALAAGYDLRHWRHLLVLVTAFTVGHSVTLALATLRVVPVPTAWVEFLIPVTIVATGLYTLWETRRHDPDAERDRHAREVKYAMALSFGLIHGMGFSTFLRALLGAEESIAWPLFAFNVGLEAGQAAILLCVLLLTAAITGFSPLRPVTWTRILSVGTVGPALALLAGRLPI